MKRTMTTAGAALGLSVMLAAGCSQESKQTQPVTTDAGGAPTKAQTSGENANRNDLALVRVIAAAPDAAPVEVIADKHTAFDRVAYKEVTPYKALPANFDDFALKTAGQAAAEPIAENSESIMGGRHYTVIVFPAIDADKTADKRVTLDVIADDLQQPSAGKARVRVINAAAGTDDVEVFLRGQEDALFGDVDFKEAIAYKEVDPINTTVEWRTSASLLTTANPKTGDRRTGQPADPAARADRADADRKDRADRTTNIDARPGKVLSSHALNLEAGKSYTIVIAGKVDGTKSRFDTIVVEDTVPPPPAATNDN